MRKIVIISLLVLLIAIVLTQYYLSYLLTSRVEKSALPYLMDNTKVKLAIEDVSIDLLNMAINFKGLSADNPPFFIDEPKMLYAKKIIAKPDIMAFFKEQRKEFRKIAINDAQLKIIRNKDNNYNIASIISLLNPNIKRKASGSSVAYTAATEKGANEPVLIKILKANFMLDYVDYTLLDPPLFLRIDAELQGNDINNFGQIDVLTSYIVASGKLSFGKHSNTSSRFEVKGRISSISSFENMSFELTGSIEGIELAQLAPLPDKIGLKTGTVRASFTLFALHGKFNYEKSQIHLNFKNVVLNEEKQQKMGGLPLPESFNVIVPVGGTILNPNIDFATSFAETMTSKDTVDMIVNKVLEQKSKIKEGKSQEQGAE